MFNLHSKCSHCKFLVVGINDMPCIKCFKEDEKPEFTEAVTSELQQIRSILNEANQIIKPENRLRGQLPLKHSELFVPNNVIYKLAQDLYNKASLIMRERMVQTLSVRNTYGIRENGLLIFYHIDTFMLKKFNKKVTMRRRSNYYDKTRI